MDIPMMAQQGWQCPCCKAVYSPFTPQCFNCKPVTVVIRDDGKTGGGYKCVKCGTEVWNNQSHTC